jgi:hypothetical protein
MISTQDILSFSFFYFLKNIRELLLEGCPQNSYNLKMFSGLKLSTVKENYVRKLFNPGKTKCSLHMITFDTSYYISSQLK